MARKIGIAPRRKVETIEGAIGTVVAHHRVRNGLSQAALADKLYCGISYISQLERGQINPSLRKLLELASALGMEAGKLVGEVDDKIRKFKPKR
jgi:transcriptional regulator with XRE-family HTH domain